MAELHQKQATETSLQQNLMHKLATARPRIQQWHLHQIKDQGKTRPADHSQVQQNQLGKAHSLPRQRVQKIVEKLLQVAQVFDPTLSHPFKLLSFHQLQV